MGHYTMQVFRGRGRPAAFMGRVGDYYIDEENHVIVGPKESRAAWPSKSISLIKRAENDVYEELMGAWSTRFDRFLLWLFRGEMFQ